MTLEELDVAQTVKKEAADLVRRISVAEGLLELSTLAGMTEGFIIALNCLKVLQPSQTDALERIFSQAIDRKMAQRS